MEHTAGLLAALEAALAATTNRLPDGDRACLQCGSISDANEEEAEVHRAGCWVPAAREAVAKARGQVNRGVQG
jgi:hypothetical protein